MRRKIAAKCQTLHAFFRPPPPQAPVKIVINSAVGVPQNVPLFAKYPPGNTTETFHIAGAQEIKRLLDTILYKFTQTDMLIIKSKPRQILVHGPSGCGKSATVRAACKESGLPYIALSPSDVRSAQVVKQLLTSAGNSFTINSGQTDICSVIIIEDIDIVLEDDRGFYKALNQLICSSKGAVVMTCSKIPEEWRRKANLFYVRLESNLNSCLLRLDMINSLEETRFTNDELEFLFRYSKGDMHRVLNMMRVRSFGLMLGMDPI